jgi:trehalose 6-phosphate phosphatase
MRGAVFDLDGVITDTASVHARAWERLFNDLFEARGSSLRFGVRTDYPAYVDGKPRYDGVASYLGSVGIELPWGQPDDPPGEATVCALGNRKNVIFQDTIERDGVVVFEGAVALLRALRQRGVPCALATSSRNGQLILDRAGLREHFDVVIDGDVASRRGLRGKPAPDVFQACARALDVRPEEAVVLEDALAGVEAGSAAEFGLVVGVDRTGDRDELLRRGAHVVIAGLVGVTPETLEGWLRSPAGIATEGGEG